MRLKICKVVYPGDTHTYDSRYITPEEFEAMLEGNEITLELLKRKGKQPDLVRRLEVAQAKLKELL